MIARIPNTYTPDAIMQATGITPKVVPNGMILELEPVNANVWHKPQHLPKESRFLTLAEERFEGAYAHVIAGMKGERFKPTHSSKKTKWQAQFCLNKFFDVAYDRLNDTLIVAMVEVQMHEEFIERIDEELFVGYPEELPGRFLFLQDAIAACMQKAECKDCKHIHYCIGGMS